MRLGRFFHNRSRLRDGFFHLAPASARGRWHPGPAWARICSAGTPRAGPCRRRRRRGFLRGLLGRGDAPSGGRGKFLTFSGTFSFRCRRSPAAPSNFSRRAASIAGARAPREARFGGGARRDRTRRERLRETLHAVRLELGGADAGRAHLRRCITTRARYGRRWDARSFASAYAANVELFAGGDDERRQRARPWRVWSARRAAGPSPRARPHPRRRLGVSGGSAARGLFHGIRALMHQCACAPRGSARGERAPGGARASPRAASTRSAAEQEPAVSRRGARPRAARWTRRSEWRGGARRARRPGSGAACGDDRARGRGTADSESRGTISSSSVRSRWSGAMPEYLAPWASRRPRAPRAPRRRRGGGGRRRGGRGPTLGVADAVRPRSPRRGPAPASRAASSRRTRRRMPVASARLKASRRKRARFAVTAPPGATRGPTYSTAGGCPWCTRPTFCSSRAWQTLRRAAPACTWRASPGSRTLSDPSRCPGWHPRGAKRRHGPSGAWSRKRTMVPCSTDVQPKKKSGAKRTEQPRAREVHWACPCGSSVAMQG